MPILTLISTLLLAWHSIVNSPSVSVVDSSNRPVAAALVELQAGGETVASQPTDGQGRAAFRNLKPDLKPAAYGLFFGQRRRRFKADFDVIF